MIHFYEDEDTYPIKEKIHKNKKRYSHHEYEQDNYRSANKKKKVNRSSVKDWNWEE